jgi:hypothetical protein
LAPARRHWRRRAASVWNTTVARRLQRLAIDYGTPLLERTRDGWEPTDMVDDAELLELVEIEVEN